MLSCYRVLDLTDERCYICGRALSDFGAEVIKIDSPESDPTKLKGPFFHDEIELSKNLHWLAFNANKKSLTLDISSPEGKEIFCRLVKTADVILDDLSP
jgi:crotonobetainyl-CoA:carnitine CoA-transferase CaiB-like acyl-CoA transferase